MLFMFRKGLFFICLAGYQPVGDCRRSSGMPFASPGSEKVSNIKWSLSRCFTAPTKRCGGRIRRLPGSPDAKNSMCFRDGGIGEEFNRIPGKPRKLSWTRKDCFRGLSGMKSGIKETSKLRKWFWLSERHGDQAVFQKRRTGGKNEIRSPGYVPRWACCVSSWEKILRRVKMKSIFIPMAKLKE